MEALESNMRHAIGCLLRNLAGELSNSENDKLGGFQWCEADDDLDDSQIAVGLRYCVCIKLDEICLARALTLEGTLMKEAPQECPDVQTYL
jgi:hypothetical protein